VSEAAYKESGAVRISAGFSQATAVVVVVALLAGCGGSSKSSSSSTSSNTKSSSSTQAATSTAGTAGANTPSAGAIVWLSAFGNRNPTALCNAYVPRLQSAFAAKSGSCPAFFSQVFAAAAKVPHATQLLDAAKSARIVGVSTQGSVSRVRYTFSGLPQPGLLVLNNVGGKWLVSQAPNVPTS
jgi:hypothetical protein